VALGGDSLSSGYKSFAAVIGNSYATYGAQGFASIAIGLQNQTKLLQWLLVRVLRLQEAVQWLLAMAVLRLDHTQLR
jgi:hypothetical protein